MTMILTTYDWVPEPPRGYVRDLRIRWALEEAGLPYEVRSTQFRDRGAEHVAHQPFHQVPWLTHDDLSIFESGAILLYVGETGGLLPAEPTARMRAVQWLFAALSSVEIFSLPWSLVQFEGEDANPPERERWDKLLSMRLEQLDEVLAGRDWLEGDFSVADILLADVLRLVDRFGGLDELPACKAYVSRATARPAFVKARDDQLAHFAAAD